MIESKINIPIKDAEKSKELQWLEQQLQEKAIMMTEERSHRTQNALLAKG